MALAPTFGGLGLGLGGLGTLDLLRRCFWYLRRLRLLLRPCELLRPPCRLLRPGGLLRLLLGGRYLRFLRLRLWLSLCAALRLRLALRLRTVALVIGLGLASIAIRQAASRLRGSVVGRR